MRRPATSATGVKRQVARQIAGVSVVLNPTPSSPRKHLRARETIKLTKCLERAQSLPNGVPSGPGSVKCACRR
jgi:hypothetical protein